jgi:hypothetical protein
MNRLTAIGLASLVAYGLLITSKYTGFVSAAREDKGSAVAVGEEAGTLHALMIGVNPEPAQKPSPLPAPVVPAEQMRASPSALEFRSARDLKAFADGLASRRANLTGDERYHLAKALEECQFTTTVNEDLAAYSAKQRRQFIQGLTAGDPLNAKRIAAYDAVDNSQRCLRFQGTKISQREIEDLYALAAQQGDARAQARLVIADLNAKINNSNRGGEQAVSARVSNDDFSRLIGLLETHDPEAMLFVGQFLAQSAMATQLHIGPNGEVPEPSAFLGAFSLVACDMVTDCVQLSREPQLACAYGGYCDAASFDELYQNFMVSPWTYSQASRYSGIIYTAINTRNWALIGLVPSASTDKRSTTIASSDQRAK